jgi:hypothetical protein
MKKALGIHTNLGRDDCDDDHGGRADRGKTDRVRKRAPPRYALSDGASEIITLI